MYRGVLMYRRTLYIRFLEHVCILYFSIYT